MKCLVQILTLTVLWVTAVQAQPAASEQREVVQPVVVGPIEDGPSGWPLTAARELSLTERLLLREQWRAYREHDRSSVRLATPIAGLGLGLGVVGLTSWLMADSDLSERRLGAALAGVFGLPLLVSSIWVLTARVKKRRAIEREIGSAAPIASLPLAWRF